ncbi:MAG: succinate dehydrogenase, partial [Pseudomonadales bacterium]|nr:succinate dehydrogenase [Pseudomonadales bacterium]NIX09275.1 succinate dehydrogenase [Pseudomonadales bacterium]
LGASSPRYNRLRRPLAAVIAVVIFVGFASVPLSIQLGIIS